VVSLDTDASAKGIRHPVSDIEPMRSQSPISPPFTSINDHLAALYRLRRFGIKLGLDTVTRIMKGLRNPHERYPCVHVAGTNGKGSVAAILASILMRAGYKVGLYTSPHLVRFNERIQVNGHPISDERLVEVAAAVQRVYTQGDPPTFFECATAMAMHHFASENIDWAVVETGMGGRYDATNVVLPKACVITNISLEHTEYLGTRLEQIAFEKAGIIKPGAGVITGTRQKHAADVIRRVASEKGVPLHRLGREIRIRMGKDGRFSYSGVEKRWRGLQVGLAGDHQRTNAALALGALELLMQQGLMISEDAIHDGLVRVRWPGRLEVAAESPLVLLDGAHNPSAIKILKQYLKDTTQPDKLTLVVGILKDKEWKTMVMDLAQIAHRLILTKPAYERAADPEMLASVLRPFDSRHVSVVPNVADAVSMAVDLARPDDTVCITGSLYTVGEAKAYLERSPFPPDEGESCLASKY
jgi:dihydrofolate synthase/folylpolyglutamate synthase